MYEFPPYDESAHIKTQCGLISIIEWPKKCLSKDSEITPGQCFIVYVSVSFQTASWRASYSIFKWTKCSTRPQIIT